MKVQRRTIRDASDPFQLPDESFVKHFRLSKNVTAHLIEELRPFILPPQRNTGISLEIKVLSSLLFFAHGSYQLSVGDNLNLGLSQQSMSKVINEISSCITANLAPRWIVFPQTNASRNRVKSGYMNKFQFPGVIGCIDCTHVAIIAPPTEDPVHPGIAYYNRKGFYSINVQLICDSDLNILSCNARFPGSSHDSAIWSLSAVKLHLENLHMQGNIQSSWLIGDSGYPLQPWLLTPIADALENTPEGQYNRCHVRARNCIERCNGVLKQRFRCLLQHRVLHYSPITAGNIIHSCVVLHNMATKARLPLPEEDVGDDINENYFNDAEGKRFNSY